MTGPPPADDEPRSGLSPRLKALTLGSMRIRSGVILGLIGSLLGMTALAVTLLREPNKPVKPVDPGRTSTASDTSDAKATRGGIAAKDFESEAKFEVALARAVDAAIDRKFEDKEWLAEKLMSVAESPHQRAALHQAFNRRDYSKMDLSGYGSTAEKIDVVLGRFAQQNSYSSPNDLVGQLREMGPESIGMLLGRLETVEASDWAQTRAILEALEGRIPVEYREDVIRHFRESGRFADFIQQHRITEVQDILFAAVEGTHEFGGRNRIPGRDAITDMMEAAVQMDPDRAELALIEHAKYGDRPLEAIRTLTSIPQARAWEEIESEIPRIRSDHERNEILPMALEHGAEGRLDLAIRVLREDDQQRRGESLQAVRRYTGAIGEAEDVAAWLAQNRQNLVWSEAEGMYILR